MLQVFQRGAQITGPNAAQGCTCSSRHQQGNKAPSYYRYAISQRILHIPVKACTGLNFTNRISSLSPPPSYTELTFLIQLTSSFLSWRNQRTAPPQVISTGIFRKATCESEELVSVLPAPVCTATPSHTQRCFQSSIATRHYFRNCLWAEPCNTFRQQKWGRWLSKEAGVKQASAASLCLTAPALHWKCHSKGYRWLAPSFGPCWMG